jgi:hypothetical protein
VDAVNKDGSSRLLTLPPGAKTKSKFEKIKQNIKLFEKIPVSHAVRNSCVYTLVCMCVCIYIYALPVYVCVLCIYTRCLERISRENPPKKKIPLLSPLPHTKAGAAPVTGKFLGPESGLRPKIALTPLFLLFFFVLCNASTCTLTQTKLVADAVSQD